MYRKFAVENLVKDLSNIILPKFDKWVEDKKNSKEIKAKIQDKIEEIELVQEMVDNMSEQFNSPETWASINIGQYSFEYNKEKDSFEIREGIEEIAKRIVYRDANLYWISWETTGKLVDRIRAIVTTLSPTSNTEVTKIVESQINFEEFLS
jgi:hypothetical protein